MKTTTTILLSIQILFYYSLSSLNKDKGSGLKHYGIGISENVTAAQWGKLDLYIASEDYINYEAVFQWDNKSLFGSAVVCGTRVASFEDYYLIEFTGTFDCSNMGSWPENVNSGFSATVKYWHTRNMVTGSYLIEGRDILPKQFGTLNVKLTNSYNSEDLPVQFPCQNDNTI